MSPGSEPIAEPPGRRFGRRFVLPARIPSFPVFRVAAIWEAFLVAASSLRQNKLRTGLTLIGIIVGVTAVIAVVTIIKGLDQTVASTFSSQGSTVFTVAKRPFIITSREDFIKSNRRKNVTKEDADAIVRLCPSCWRTGVAANARELIKHGDQKSEDVPVRGVTLSMFEIEDISIEAGRTWSDSEGEAGDAVCVVGADILENLFDNAPPDQVVGKEIRLAGRPFQIVGVAEKQGKIFGFSRDNFVLFPYPTYQKVYGARDSIIIHIQVSVADHLEEAEDQVRAIMRNR